MGLPRHLIMTYCDVSGAVRKVWIGETDILSLGNGGEVDFDLGHGEDVGGSRHGC